MLSAGSPQGCVLRPLLFMLLTHDCVSRYEGKLVIKFEDDITVVVAEMMNQCTGKKLNVLWAGVE